MCQGKLCKFYNKVRLFAAAKARRHKAPGIISTSNSSFLPISVHVIDVQIINYTRLEGEIRVSRTVSYVVEGFD